MGRLTELPDPASAQGAFLGQDQYPQASPLRRPPDHPSASWKNTQSPWNSPQYTHTHAHTVPCPETLRPRVPVPGAPSFLAPVLCFQELSLCSLEMTPEWLEPLPRNSDRHKCLGVYCHSPPLSCLKPVHGWRVQEDSQIPCPLRDTRRDDWSSRAPPRIRAASNFTNNHFIHPYPACLTPLLNSPRALP